MKLLKWILWFCVIEVFLTGCGINSFSPDSRGNCNGEIKGNVSMYGKQKIFHVPGGRFYLATRAEECFHTIKDARAANYRPSQH